MRLQHDPQTALEQTGKQDNNLKVIIDYTDTTGERKSVEKVVPIQFRTTTTSSQMQTTHDTAFWQTNTFRILAAIGALLICFFVYKKIRRRKI